ncbi:MAG TPA: hypothetical protein VLV81_13655 [Acidimicrobiia bacterium]|nr:hypothetical protein [Acidimicrobiia bacterium]
MDPVRKDAPPNPPRDDTTDDPADPDATRGFPPPTAVESLVNALLEAGPEVAEHVVRAAQELVLAAQAVVDAAERAVDEQKDLRSPAPEPAPPAAANVHPIDRTE